MSANAVSANGKVPTRALGISANMSRVLREVAFGKNSPQLIADVIGSDRGTVHRTLQSLVKRGFVTYDKPSRHYYLSTEGQLAAIKIAAGIVPTKVPTDSSEGRSTANGFSKVPTRNANARKLSDKRGHNLRVKFPVLGAPKGWKESPKEFFREKIVGVKPLGLRNVDGVQFTMDEVDFRVTATSIVMTTKKERYVGDMPSLMEWLITLSFDAKEKLERDYPQLRLGAKPLIIVGEVAHEGDPITALEKAQHFKVIRHTDGKARVQFDRSKGPVEIEFLHPGMFDADSETWDRRITQILDSPYDYDMLGVMVEEASHKNDEQDERIREMLELASVTTRNIASTASNVDYFGVHMVSHVSAIQSIDRGIAKLTEVVTELRSQNTQRKQRGFRWRGRR